MHFTSFFLQGKRHRRPQNPLREWGVRGTSLSTEEREAERRKAHLGNGRGLFPGLPRNRGTRQRLSASRRGVLLASARSSKAQEASQRPTDHDGFPAVTCTSPSHLVAGPHSGAGRGPKASRVCVCETQPRAPHLPSDCPSGQLSLCPTSDRLMKRPSLDRTRAG